MLTKLGITSTSAIVYKPSIVANLIHGTMVVTKTPGVNLAFSVMGKS